MNPGEGGLIPATTRPATEAELMARARAMAGRTVGWLAERCGMRLPDEPKRAKGFVGMLLEQALGATAAARGIPDFPGLGIELKSIPVDRSGTPRESTWVCIAPVDGSLATRWEASRVQHKLARVLFIPVLADRALAQGDRLIGQPLLWRPDPDEEATLAADWAELTELLRLGRVGDVTAHRGRALQLRPKAASSRELEWTLAEDLSWVRAGPLGFYLRSRFTAQILARHYALPGGVDR